MSGLVGKRVCVGVQGLVVGFLYEFHLSGPLPQPPVDLPCFELIYLLFIQSVLISAAAI